MHHVRPDLVGHPDRLRWNARYQGGFIASFTAHPLAVRALSVQLPAGPVLDLASGPSGSVLLAARTGRQVTAVDASEVALHLLSDEAERRGLRELITLVHADLKVWRPPRGGNSLVLCTGYWDRSVFAAAAASVAVDGLLGWEAFTAGARRERPHLPAQWCLGAGEPAALLPADFAIMEQHDLPDDDAATKRQLLARRLAESARKACGGAT